LLGDGKTGKNYWRETVSQYVLLKGATGGCANLLTTRGGGASKMGTWSIETLTKKDFRKNAIGQTKVELLPGRGERSAVTAKGSKKWGKGKARKLKGVPADGKNNLNSYWGGGSEAGRKREGSRFSNERGAVLTQTTGKKPI